MPASLPACSCSAPLLLNLLNATICRSTLLKVGHTKKKLSGVREWPTWGQRAHEQQGGGGWRGVKIIKIIKISSPISDLRIRARRWWMVAGSQPLLAENLCNNGQGPQGTSVDSPLSPRYSKWRRRWDRCWRWRRCQPLGQGSGRRTS